MIRSAVWTVALLGIAAVAVGTLMGVFLSDIRFLYGTAVAYALVGILLQRLEIVGLEDGGPYMGFRDAHDGKVDAMPLHWRMRVIVFWLPWWLSVRGGALMVVPLVGLQRLWHWGLVGGKPKPGLENLFEEASKSPRVFRIPKELAPQPAPVSGEGQADVDDHDKDTPAPSNGHGDPSALADTREVVGTPSRK